MAPASAVEWQQRFEHRQEECRSIPAGDYETGLIFNPAGYHTYYKRDRCVQRLAIEWRDASLCTLVRERRSLLFNGSGVSEAACIHHVAEQNARDHEAAAAIDPASFHKLTGFSFEQPHYAGDNLLVRLQTRGTHPGIYQVRIEVWPSDTADPVMIDDYSQPLGVDDHSLTRALPNQRLREALGTYALDREIRLRAILELPLRSHEDQFVLSRKQPQTRRSSLETQHQLSGL